MSTAGLLAAVAVVVSWITTRLLSRNGGTLGLDVPNHRSLHDEEVTRTGGIGILVGAGAVIVLERALGAGAVTATRELAIILLSATAIAVVFVIDDLRGLPILFRLFVQFVLATGVVMAAGLWQVAVLGLEPSWLTGTLAVLGVVWVMNLYNFMDGMDGFAGGMTVAGFGVLAALGFRGGETSLALASLAVAAGALGFLPHNWPKARIFMGDGGSVTIGFLAAAFSLWGTVRGVFSLWVPLLAFSPFILDATWTLLKRAAKGEKVWLAHREHLYQRLVLSGWSQPRTLALEYGMMVVAAAAALLFDFVGAGAQLAIEGAVVAGFLGLMVFVRKRGSLEDAAASSELGELLERTAPREEPMDLPGRASGGGKRAVSA